MKLKINSVILGVAIGIVVPILSVLLAYMVRFQDELTIKEFINNLLNYRVYTKVMALGVYFGNIVFFFLFIKIDLLKTARGLLFATILYSFVVIVLRFGM